MMTRALVAVFMMSTLGAMGGDGPDHLRQGYGGPPKLHAKAEGPSLNWPVGATVHARQQQQPPPQQEEFVPIDELPPQDQLPAAPLLVTAYSFVVLALFVYLISVARRLGGVQRELERLQSDLKRSGRT